MPQKSIVGAGAEPVRVDESERVKEEVVKEMARREWMWIATEVLRCRYVTEGLARMRRVQDENGKVETARQEQRALVLAGAPERDRIGPGKQRRD